jgi:Glycosyltransferase Family 4
LAGSKRVLIIAPYPVFPALAGGKIRICSLAKAMHGQGVEVDIVTPFLFGQRAALDNGFPCPIKQVPYPFLWALLTDRPLPFQFLTSFHPGLKYMVGPLLSGYDIIQFEHIPFSSLLELVPTDTKVVYDAHNVEYDYVQGECSGLSEPLSRMIGRRVAQCESRLLNRADSVLVVSESDEERFRQLYGVQKDKFVMVPNGVKNQLPRGCRERLWKRFPALRDQRRILVFSGSDVAHNRDAVDELLRHVAPHLDNTSAMVIHGPVTQRLRNRRNPPHLFLDCEGHFEDYAEVGAIGLNPVRIGGGTSLKLLHYLSYGMRVVTTPFGIRGNEYLTPHVSVVEIEDFWSALNASFETLPPVEAIGEELGWNRIGKDLANHYVQLVHRYYDEACWTRTFSPTSSGGI